MLTRALAYLRYQPIALLALFLAIGGGTAMALPGTNTVDSRDIINTEVKSPDIRNGHVRTADIGDDHVRSGDVRDDTLPGGGLGSADIGNDAVGSSEIGNDAVGSSEIGPNAVNSSELGAAAVDARSLQNFHTHAGNIVNVVDGTALNGDWTQGPNSTASCNAALNEQLVGYYLEWTTSGDELATRQIVPNFSNNSVIAQGISDDGGTRSYRAVAVCVFG